MNQQQKGMLWRHLTLYVCLKLPNGVVDRWNRKVLILQKSQQGEPSLKDFTDFFDDETALDNTPTYLREAITAYVGIQKTSDYQRKRRSNSKEYGSFETDFNHHKPEAQDKCILCSHKDDLDNCVEYMKKSREEGRKLLTWKEQCFGCYEPISMSQKVRTCNDRQKC